ncbi:MAG: IS1634 family transposase, partial [Verrucomicrobia bacterium]|nr:IS1634 family transposase [Verrucomicrobiota bacterium]
MFLRCSKRRKEGKEHLYWSVVENRRRPDQRSVQRHVLYLGELNGVQESSWRKTVDLFGQDEDTPRQVALFPEAHAPAHPGVEEFPSVRVRLSQMALCRPRQWGACWLGCQLWEQLGLGGFWRAKLIPSREGTRWDQVLQTLGLYRLIDPGSEWRRPRHWFEHTASADLLAGDFALAEIHRLYECHDKLVAHKAALFDHLTARWRELFDAQFEVLLYDLTSTYFESDPPADPADPRRFGYLLRTNLTETDPAKLWEFYLQLTEVEQAFKELKGDLARRPIHHQLAPRIEAHLFVSFLACCL